MGAGSSPRTGRRRPIALVGGISYPRAEVFDNLALGFARSYAARAAAQQRRHLLRGCCTQRGGVAEHGNAPCTIDDLCALDLITGPWPRISTSAHPPARPSVAVYQAVPRAKPQGDRPRGCCGACLKGREGAREFVPLDTVRWTAFDLDITDRRYGPAPRHPDAEVRG